MRSPIARAATEAWAFASCVVIVAVAILVVVVVVVVVLLLLDGHRGHGVDDLRDLHAAGQRGQDAKHQRRRGCHAPPNGKGGKGADARTRRRAGWAVAVA
eukprot:Skav212591  [mRNA]  locus=scaffold125:542481:543962:- [translate_table: standard]